MGAANDSAGASRGLPATAVHGTGVSDVSGLLAASGQEIKDSLGKLLNEIVGYEQARPWGDDEVGEEFLARVYHTPVNGTPFHELMQTVLKEAGDELIKEFGPGGRHAAQRYHDSDSVAGQRMTA